MEVTRESRRARWTIMFVTWAFVAAAASWHTGIMRDYVGVLDGAAPARAEVLSLVRPMPSSFADGQAWVRYALAAQESGVARVRFTAIDNAPHGRPVHWSSWITQLIAGAGRIQHAMTGEPLPRATENALAWFNLPLLLACVIGLSGWAAARAGAGAGVLVALAIPGLRAFYDAFAPNYVDHHGVLTAANAGLILGALFMGVGWWRGRSEHSLLPASLVVARRAATVSGACGGIGLAISAASTIPPIGIVGMAGVVATIWWGRAARTDGAIFAPEVWRHWGRVGAATSFVLYLLEYAPSHFSLRLEVNHPLHAVAWLAGSELVALLASWHLDRDAGRPPAKRVALAVAGLALAPIAVALGGTAVFMVRDPFVAELRHTVAEGMSFRAATQLFGSGYTRRYLINFVLVGGAAILVAAIRPNRLVTGFATLVAMAFVALACWEIRWWVVGSAAMLGLIVTALAALTATRTTAVRWTLVLTVAAMLLPTGIFTSGRVLRAQIDAKSADAGDLLQPIFRDMAAALRASQPNGDIILLSSPDASNSIGYYGGFRTVGTLYWENVDGLKAAAAIFCADTDEEARRLIEARGITHLALVSRGNYLAEYLRLLKPGTHPRDIERTFGHRLLMQQAVPDWLRVISYQPPPNIVLPDLKILLLQVGAAQNEFEAAWSSAGLQLNFGNAAAAQRSFERAIALVPAEKRAELYQKAGDLAYQQRAHGAAIRLYRAGLSASGHPALAGNLAWVLATSPEATLRNGAEALALAEAAVKANPADAGLVNTLAAALAETGRFTEAAAAAERVLQAVRGSVDADVAQLLQRRVETYRAGRPWRE